MRWLWQSESVVRPWKNGGGVTREIAIWPELATIDDFGWRISAAEVTADGPFSPFPDVDRVLVLLEGAGMDLWAGEQVERLRQPGAIARFPGERPIVGRLPGGPTRDLNVMTRRGVWSAEVRVVEDRCAVAGVLVGLDGTPTVGGIPLGPGDAVFGEDLAFDGPGRAVAVTLSAVR